MIQGGCPNGNGTGGSGQTIHGEFSANGFDNTLSHTKGVVSMARRADDYDSASSQFFICVADRPDLDGNYAAFGKVVYGMDVIEEIALAPTIGERPVQKLEMITVRFAYPSIAG